MTFQYFYGKNLKQIYKNFYLFIKLIENENNKIIFKGFNLQS